MTKKFFIVFAWPTTSGALHVGHARSYTIPDIIARYKRERGYEVFFPVGFHATGEDCINIFNKISSDPSEAQFYNISKEEVNSVHSPENLEKLFEQKYIEIFKLANMSLDYNARTSTIDPSYHKFIEWQFAKLNELGYLVKKDYRLPWCPNDNHAVSLDEAEADVKASKGAVIQTLNIAELDSRQGYKIWGYTDKAYPIESIKSIEADPSIEYALCDIDGEKVVVGKDSIKKFTALGRDVKVEGEKKGSELIGKSVSVGKRLVEVKEAKLDKDYGTGIRLVFDKETASDDHSQRNSVDTVAMGYATNMYELSVRPIYCRCGAEIEIRAVKGQWFIDYQNPEWKKLDKRLIDKIETSPSPYKEELYSIIDWLDDRPCTRRVGMGTKFPYDNSWIIEALSDSTIYMAFYAITPWINRGVLNESNLTHEFFDYVFLGKGDKNEAAKGSNIKIEMLDSIRAGFKELYPLDVNFGGVEHKKAHFPLFIANHAAIFPEELWPKRIALNWHVIVEGQKMSKHLGNALLWKSAIEKFGVDAVRLYLVSGANQWSQFDWSNSGAEVYAKHINSFKDLVRNRLEAAAASGASKNNEIVDKWFESKINSAIRDTTKYMESYQMREAIMAAFFDFNNVFSTYLAFGGSSGRLIKEAVLDQLVLLKPFIPTTSESLIKEALHAEPHIWPVADSAKINKKLEEVVDSINKTIRDINSIQKIATGKDKCALYAATDDEYSVYDALAGFISEQTGLTHIIVGKSSDNVTLLVDGAKQSKRPAYLRPALFLGNEIDTIKEDKKSA